MTVVGPQQIGPHPALSVVSYFLGLIPILFSYAGFWGPLVPAAFLQDGWREYHPLPCPRIIVNLRPGVTWAL